ncbi:Coiled-coil domain-containing protein 96 [Rhizophlyctis rosea]|nr:Coiled-coil domain-containing protein 96 [Rhizophlyctis rosea]
MSEPVELNPATAASVTSLTKSASRAASQSNLSKSRAQSRASLGSRAALNTGTTGSRAASRANLATPSRPPTTTSAADSSTSIPADAAVAPPTPATEGDAAQATSTPPADAAATDIAAPPPASTQSDQPPPIPATEGEADSASAEQLQRNLDATSSTLAATHSLIDLAVPQSPPDADTSDTQTPSEGAPPIDVEPESYGPDVTFIPQTKRILESPPPGAAGPRIGAGGEEGEQEPESGKFVFVNVDYGADPDADIFLFSAAQVSRGETPEGEGAAEDAGDEEVRRKRRGADEPGTPILRPSSPTGFVPVVDEVPEGEAVEGGVVPSGEVAGTAGPAVMLPETVIQEGIDRDELILSIKQQLDEKDKLKARNGVLQNKLGEYFRRKRTDETRDTEKSVTDQEHRYTTSLTTLAELHTTLDVLNSTNERTRSDLRARLTEKLSEAEEKAQEFAKFKTTVALSAENSRTGKPIPAKVVEQLEGMEERKEAEVVAVRLENIKLRNKLRRHEALLKQKEELADGLHLIDFEQLKIENQTYNEKIEERNEELLKLRKKITTIVHLLTHVKEKLQFVQSENTSLSSLLSSLDAQVGEQRDTLPQQKQARDKLRTQNVELRRRNGLVGNRGLLRDFEDKVDASTLLQQKLEQLRKTHAGLVREMVTTKRKIQKAQIIKMGSL